ncbi:Phage portal protein [compost metagenome]
MVVPAREIIHDTMICLFHPLVGVSPIYACGLAAMQGMAIQDQSAQFFANGSKPSGILTAPKSISDETAQRLKEH